MGKIIICMCASCCYCFVFIFIMHSWVYRVLIVQHLLCTVAHPVMSATCPFLFHCEPSGGFNAIEVVQEQANDQLGRAVNVLST